MDFQTDNAELVLLFPQDQQRYLDLKQGFEQSKIDYSVNAFLERLRKIYEFETRDGIWERNRQAVCGFAPFRDGGVAVNKSRLARLLSKSGSTVQRNLRELGYEIPPADTNRKPEFEAVIDGLCHDPADRRHWVIRVNANPPDFRVQLDLDGEPFDFRAQDWETWDEGGLTQNEEPMDEQFLN
jgi:hypothetical protein